MINLCSYKGEPAAAIGYPDAFSAYEHRTIYRVSVVTTEIVELGTSAQDDRVNDL